MPDAAVPFAAEYREFRANTADHVMTVLHDDGVYRHLRFRKPGTGIWGFDIVTWPRHLAITGDLKAYTFALMYDMFEFFTVTPGHINPNYWAEKLVARSEVQAHSPESFTRQVVAAFWEQRHEFTDTAALFRAIREDVLAFAEYGPEAEAALDAFRYLSEDGSEEFVFTDWQGWDFTDWSPHYLRALHAITWGIRRYLEAATVRPLGEPHA